MRLAILASTLLVAGMAASQNSPSSTPGAPPSVAPPIILSQGSSDTCLAIRTVQVPRTERMPLVAPDPRPNSRGRGRIYVLPRSIPGSPGEVTCTPANRFRAMYIPNPTVRRDTVPAQCSDCGSLPKDKPAPEVQQVRQPQ